MSEHETFLQQWVVCPHCGHDHEDSEKCNQPFQATREVTVYYSTTATPNQQKGQ